MTISASENADAGNGYICNVLASAALFSVTLIHFICLSGERGDGNGWVLISEPGLFRFYPRHEILLPVMKPRNNIVY